MSEGKLLVFETHPVQYRAPMYRFLQQKMGIPVTVVYGSDFSVAGRRDPGFGIPIAWDNDLLSGYTPQFLSRVSQGAEGPVIQGMGEMLRREKPASVLLTGYSPLYYQAAFFHAWSGGYPILLRCESRDPPAWASPLKRMLKDPLRRWIYRKCDKVLYVGKSSYRHYRRLGVPEAKLVYSPYSVDTGPFQADEGSHARMRAETRRELEIPEGRIAVLFSGKFSRHKGVDLVLPAVAALEQEARGRVTVLLMGAGEMEPMLRRQAEQMPLPGGVRFLGFQNQSRLSPHYLASDLLVLPSRSETWGLVVNEALHHGLPALVSDEVGCASDLVEEEVTGELFKTGSVEGLTSAIRRGLKLAGDERVRAACRRKVESYSIEASASGIARAHREAGRRG